MRRLLAVSIVMAACNSGSSGSDGGVLPMASFFDACGGKIFDSAGNVSVDEYRRQARLWDRATLDCRLGPKFADLHPGDSDSNRPTAPELPLTPHAGATLCPQFNHDTKGPAGFGSTSGQVGYAPSDGNDPGMDRLQTSGWEGPGECFQPLQGGWLGGPHPDPAITGWQKSQPMLGVPIAKGRTEYAETGDGVVIFSSGFIGTTGTQTSGGTHPSIVLPPNKVPTAVAVTNFNELALVTVWDVDTQKGQVAVIALHAQSPPSFSIKLFCAPNEGGFDAMQLLGYVDLPELRAPTAIAVAGNNRGHNGPWVQSGTHAYQGVGTIFSDLSFAAMTSNDASSVWTSDPTKGYGFFGSAGGAIIAGKWENKVTFLDLTPLFAFVRKVYVDPIANKNNEPLYTSATATPWPFDFSTNPEMIPTVVTTVAVSRPNVVRYGIRANTNGKGLQKTLLAWVGNVDGHLFGYDVTAGSVPSQIADVVVDANPTSLHLTNANDSLMLSSRGNRSLAWLSVGATTIDTERQFRDSRVDDPVATDNNQRMPVITIGDFTAGTVLNFEHSEAPCPTPDAGATTCTTYAYDGKLTFPGAVYFVDTANVN